MNRQTIQQAERTRQELENLEHDLDDLRAAKASQRVFAGDRDWHSLVLAGWHLWIPWDALCAPMAKLPGGVLRRAKGVPAADPFTRLLDVLAHVPGEPLGGKAKELKQTARVAAQAETNPLFALALAWIAVILDEDKHLRRARKLCWRRAGAGWQLSRKVERLVAAPQEQRDLSELKSEGLVTTSGHALSPAVVMPGGSLVRPIDTTKPRVDMEAFRRAAD